MKNKLCYILSTSYESQPGRFVFITLIISGIASSASAHNATSDHAASNDTPTDWQQAILSQTATIKSLSFYVTGTGGNLRLGIYDSLDANGNPGALKAQIAEFTSVVGWNTQNVTSQVQLAPGTYWIVYFPQSNALSFVRGGNSLFSGVK